MVLLQKQWRGYLCRQKYKKMKAALILMYHYKRYKQRVYINELERTFRSAKNMQNYGKHLPWPRENFAVRHVVPALKNMYARWWAWMILRVIPREDWPQLRLKAGFWQFPLLLLFLLLQKVNNNYHSSILRKKKNDNNF